MPKSLPWFLALGFLVSACASTDTEITKARNSNDSLPYPERILVYDFATSFDQLDRDTAVGKELAETTTARPVDEEERKLACAAAEVVAVKLTAEIKALDLPAEAIVAEAVKTLDGPKAQWFSFLGGKRRGASWPAGMYQAAYELSREVEGQDRPVLTIHRQIELR